MTDGGRTETKELQKGEAQQSLAGMIALVVARTSSVLARNVFGPALRKPFLEAHETATRQMLPAWLPNGYVLSFLALVVVPSLVCVLYLTFIAADQFMAEVRFAVKTARFDVTSEKVAAKPGALSLGGISLPAVANQDAYVISNYILSRSVIEDLASKIDPRVLFRAPEADFWARLPAHASAEELTGYWKKMVSSYVDSVSGIVTVTVRAFRPGDARNLAAAILDASEKLANDVSTRARRAVMQQAEDEMRRSEGLVRAALVDLRNFRDKQGFIDPVSVASSTGDLIMQAMGEKIELQNSYYVAVKATSADAPTAVALRRRLDALDEQIEQLKAKLTGNSPEGRTISASLVKFEELELKKGFAEKLYTMAQDGLERARLKAEQQNIFVETFVRPAVPEDAKYPERLSLSLLIPLGLAIIWGIFALIAAAVNDHRY